MACTIKSPKCATPNSCCLKHVEDILVYTTALLDEFKINYWLDYNSLRGSLENKVYHDNNVISFNDDKLEMISFLQHRIFEDGFFLSYHSVDRIFRVQRSVRNHVAVSLFNWTNHRNVCTHAGEIPRRFEHLSTVSHSWLGREMKRPQNAEEYIKIYLR